jgi:tetrahydromethanopterin S-methyltransferase subunit F
MQLSEALLYYEKQPLSQQRRINSFFLDNTCEGLSGGFVIIIILIIIILIIHHV